MKKLIVLSALVVGMLAQAQLPVTWDFDYTVSGDLPESATPWLTVNISQETPTSVLMTINNYLGSDEALKSLAFNLSPLLGVNYALVSGPSFNVDIAEDAINSGPAHGFDVQVSYEIAPPSTRFTGGGTSVLRWSSLNSIHPEHFDFRNLEGAATGYLAVAHVIALNPDNEGSAWIVPHIPEPQTYALLASLGLLTFGLWRKVRA